MKITQVSPKKVLNQAFRKERITQSEMDFFKKNLKILFEALDAQPKEQEEHYKNIITAFLKDAFYKADYQMNTKQNLDLVIRMGKKNKDTVAVLFETKKPNSPEMISEAKPNAKALHQLIFYYLQERIDDKNIEIRHLIITDIYNWYIFDENWFDKNIYRNPAFIKGYEQVKQRRKDTDFFYNQVAKPLLDALEVELKVPFFNLNDFKSIVFEQNSVEDSKLIPLYKILSPTHLIKLPFANDSNQLDKHFYSELLHIIGLEEVKEGSKKLIQRKVNRNEFSLLENTISKIENRGYLQPYSMALELCITWINRVLFLKLLEAQLVAYHKGDKDYCFLNTTVIQDYSRLNKLFFEVLAERTESRKGKTQLEFEKIPYLNSSLFELTPLEQIITMNDLDRDETMPIAEHTVLKDAQGKPITGELPTLDYLLTFLDSYDFASEGSEGIQSHKRTLINASVLGLIFEKINGYKDGSFFTPGFITMYMSRETIRRAVIQKFKDSQLPHFQQIKTIEDLNEAITDRKQANDWINELKICDPAVGSGHFLVSALNEIIAIKADLGVLMFRDGKRLRNFEIFVQNDELIVTDEDTGDIFQYYVNEKGVPPKEVQRVQEMLFHEKQTIIENGLFGVDINPNSVKICRLRLWIELLKNAYYTENSQYKALETLPNIDINIKKGNSLISRFKLQDDLSEVFKKQKFSYPAYRKAVETYKNTNSKPAKAALSTFIDAIKAEFQLVFHKNIKEFRDYAKLKGQLSILRTQGDIFGQGIDAVEEDRLENLVAQAESKVKAIQENVIYQDAFEWRFEFPEILDKNGVFVGFDVVIGNPPYIPLEHFTEIEKGEFRKKYPVLERKYESSVLFMLESFLLSNENGYLSFIAPLTWQTGENYSKFRNFLYKTYGIELIVNLPFNIFEDAYVDTAIYVLAKKAQSEFKFFAFDKKAKDISFETAPFRIMNVQDLAINDYKIILDDFTEQLLSKLATNCFILLGEITKSTQGLSASNFEKIVQTSEIDTYPFLEKGNVYNYQLVTERIFQTTLHHKPSLKPFYEAEPKILIRRIINRQNRLSVGFTDQKIIFKKDINPFIPTNSNFSASFLLGVMASKLISFIYLKISVIATKDDFRQTTLSELRRIPIPNVSLLEQQPIIEPVEKILALKKAEPSQSTTDLEKEIDKMVYVLYGLTASEIEVIEASM
jgi:adenine-specific DNA-methyltransferase